jgi:NADH-quinone oxidoreductase subunit M
LGAVLVSLFPGGKATKTISFLASLTTFIFSLLLYVRFDPADGGFQFQELVPLVPRLSINYSLGLDGLSLWLILLATFITPLVILGSFRMIDRNLRGFYACLLLLESAVIGTLAATDLFLFYLFWELMLIPAFFLIGVWGGPNRVKGTVKFVLFTMAGSLLMLVALIYVTHEVKSFDYAKIFEHVFPEDVQFWCFLAFALAFLIKVPLFPFHGWLPDAYTEAPAGGTVMLSAIMVKLGAYGLLRFCIPLFPEAAKSFAPWIMVLAVAGVIHGALMAILQTDFKRLLAYSSLSHMGLITLGIFTFSLTGLQGGIIQMIGHGVYMAGLFLLAGMLYQRKGTHEMDAYGGVAKAAPLLAAAFLWMILSAAGLPGFAGFPGEILILTSAYKTWALPALLAITGFVLSAWYLFNLYGKVFFGQSKANPEDVKAPKPKKSIEPLKITDLSWPEGLALLPLALAALWIGLNANFFLEPVEKTLQMKVIEKLKPPPAMMDFAAQQRRLQDEMEKGEKPQPNR